MAQSSTYLQWGPSLPAWLPSPSLPPAQTAILLSPLTVAAAIIFLGCALWKDAKSRACFSGSDQHFFLINGIFLILSDLISLNAFILHPWVGPIFLPSRTNLTYLCWFLKEKVWSPFLSHLTVCLWRGERRCPVPKNPKHAFSFGAANRFPVPWKICYHSFLLVLFQSM